MFHCNNLLDQNFTYAWKNCEVQCWILVGSSTTNREIRFMPRNNIPIVICLRFWDFFFTRIHLHWFVGFNSTESSGVSDIMDNFESGFTRFWITITTISYSIRSSRFVMEVTGIGNIIAIFIRI